MKVQRDCFSGTWLLVIVPLFALVLPGNDSLSAQENLGQQFALKFGFFEQPKIIGNEYVPMLTEALTTELQFAKRICDPSPEQFDQIHLSGLESLESLSIVYAGLQKQRAKVESWPDPNETLSQGLAETITSIMPAEVAQRYLAQSKARFAANKDANVAVLANLIDRRVCLSPDQQRELFDTLKQDWQPNWSHANVALIYSRYAVFPEKYVLRPLLNELQEELWDYVPRRRNVSLSWQIHFAANDNFGFGPGLKPFDVPKNRVADGNADERNRD